MCAGQPQYDTQTTKRGSKNDPARRLLISFRQRNNKLGKKLAGQREKRSCSLERNTSKVWVSVHGELNNMVNKRRGSRSCLSRLFGRGCFMLVIKGVSRCREGRAPFPWDVCSCMWGGWRCPSGTGCFPSHFNSRCSVCHCGVFWETCHVYGLKNFILLWCQFF